MNPREMRPLRLSDERVIECLLEMFRVHQKHACRLHFDQGCIGEPYVISNIMAEAVKRLH